jgi:hypothetical protein
LMQAKRACKSREFIFQLITVLFDSLSFKEGKVLRFHPKA